MRRPQRGGSGGAERRQLEKLGRLLIAYGRALRTNAMQAPKPMQQGGVGITWQQLQGL
jgi:hypothetical protein